MFLVESSKFFKFCQHLILKIETPIIWEVCDLEAFAGCISFALIHHTGLDIIFACAMRPFINISVVTLTIHFYWCIVLSSLWSRADSRVAVPLVSSFFDKADHWRRWKEDATAQLINQTKEKGTTRLPFHYSNLGLGHKKHGICSFLQISTCFWHCRSQRRLFWRLSSNQLCLWRKLYCCEWEICRGLRGSRWRWCLYSLTYW